MNTRSPILLPVKHKFTCLFIKQSHESVKHGGIRDTLTTLQERYRVLRGHEAVKKFTWSCVICRKHEGTPYGPLPPADLPSNRVSEDPPFTHIGLDFAGPLYIEIKNTEDEVKESQTFYVCVFMCVSTQAVHLELTQALSVKSFLLAFRRFTSQRGLPATITSDNAKMFRSSSQDICKIARAEDVWQYLANKQISWNFIIEEGLVVGRILGTTCQKHQETFEEDPRKIYSQFWQTTHCFSGNQRRHQFQTPHVCVRWQWINILPCNTFWFDLWKMNYDNSKRYSLWSD